MKALIKNDLVTGKIDGNAIGIDIPENLADFPSNRLRFDGTSIVDGADYSAFWIDENGRKHISADYGSQELPCAWDDVLSHSSGSWVVLTVDDQKWNEVRAKRDRLLAESDWTQVNDAPLTEAQKTEWTTYRQALRDIPQTFSNPNTVVYPEKP